MNARKFAVLVSAVALFASGASQAFAAGEQEFNKTVKLLSIKEGGASVVVNEAGPSGACDLSKVGFDATTPVGRIWYATLLEALSTGASVDLGYERTANLCRLVQVQIH
jgi:hypothetical protein